MLISWTVEEICRTLGRGEEVVLATVVSKSGSAPCLAGSKMIVRRDGASTGTIGGGVLEAEGQRRAGQVLESGRSQLFTFDLSGRDAASMAMICGGRVQVLLELITVDADTVAVYRGLGEAVAMGERCFLVTDLGPAESELDRLGRCLVRQDGSVTGHFDHPAGWIPHLVAQARRATYPVLVLREGHRFLVERCYAPSTLYLFGAGHVSQEVAEMAGRVAFQTVVLDDRPEFANRERFPTADEVRVIDSFEKCIAGLPIDGDSYLAIVTRGHTHDRTVLEQALMTDAAYIGMLGSRKKSVEIRRALREQGFDEARVNGVHCPIGIDITAETTAEIAVSIVAELIRVRAARGDDGR